MKRHTFMSALLSVGLLAGCGGQWQTDYDAPVDASVSQGWRLSNVAVVVPEDLTVSENNTLAPNADIVWHGDERGDRRAQVAAVVDNGITLGAKNLPGSRPVQINVTVVEFHAVTPAAVQRSPGAVHNITYIAQVVDAATGAPLTKAERIVADLDANVGVNAVIAAQQGRTQKSRITNHLAQVTAGWLGIGPDARRTFTSIGR